MSERDDKNKKEPEQEARPLSPSPEEVESFVPQDAESPPPEDAEPPSLEDAETPLLEDAEIPSLEELVHSLDQEVAGVSDAVLSEGEAPTADEARYLLFTLGDTRYGARVGSVIEIATIPELTPVPNVPAWVRGVANLRGEILAVLDFRVFLGSEPLGLASGSRMLVTRLGRDELTAGLMVDAVNGVTTMRTAELEPPTAPIESELSAFLLGVQEHGGRLVAVVDLERLLTSPEVRQFEPAA